MSAFLILILINFLWLAYLTFLIYKKLSVKNLPPISNSKGAIGGFKYGLVRYNPFDDLGGDQSFSLALLDQNNSGIIITSLHTRDNTRVFAKPIIRGEGESVSLSRDEKLAILKAIKG